MHKKWRKRVLPSAREVTTVPTAEVLPDVVQARLIQMRAEPHPCLLCGNLATYTAVFKPDAPMLWGGVPGKQRYMGYALCARCYGQPNVIFQVEARLQTDMGARRN